MSTRLVILGFLQRKDLHGYEIKQIIEREMGDWTNIAFGSIYFALSKLTDEGFITPKEKQKENYRPSRIIYGITEKGKKEFIRLLQSLWKEFSWQYNPIDIAFYFSEYFPPEKAKKYLKRRLKTIKYAYKHVRKHKQEVLSEQGVPKIAEAIFNHSLHQLKAEYFWLKDVVKKIETGFYK